MVFLKEQDYGIKDNIIYQNNQSATRMDKHGRKWCTWNSRNINIQYVFITDRIDKKETRVEYYPALEMFGDYFTRPLQGKLFRAFWEILMRYMLIRKLKISFVSIEERIESIIKND